jgi:hypothetical protein
LRPGFGDKLPWAPSCCAFASIVITVSRAS